MFSLDLDPACVNWLVQASQSLVGRMGASWVLARPALGLSLKKKKKYHFLRLGKQSQHLSGQSGALQMHILVHWSLPIEASSLRQRPGVGADNSMETQSAQCSMRPWRCECDVMVTLKQHTLGFYTITS